MATNLHVLAPPPSVAQEAVLCDLRIRSAIKAYHRSFGSLAHWSWKLKAMDGYEVLGYPNEHEYFVSLGVSRSWYYHAVAIGQACSHLTEQELGDIPVGTAELMLSVRPEIKTLYPWAEEAKTLTYTQFARNIEERNATIPGESKERMAVLSIRVPATAKEAILGNLEAFKERNELASPGQALEFVVADRFDRRNVLACIESARKTFGWCADYIKRNFESEAKLTENLQAARAKLEEAYMEIIAANREDRDDAIRETQAPAAEGQAEGDQDDAGWPSGDEAERGWV